jgi:hypothetical protein
MEELRSTGPVVDAVDGSQAAKVSAGISGESVTTEPYKHTLAEFERCFGLEAVEGTAIRIFRSSECDDQSDRDYIKSRHQLNRDKISGR